MPLGFRRKKEEPETEKSEYKFDVKYLGGHKAFPSKKSIKTKIFVYAERIDIDAPFNLNIPYSQINKIENMDDKKNICFKSCWTRFSIFASCNCRCHVEKKKGIHGY